MLFDTLAAFDMLNQSLILEILLYRVFTVVFWFSSYLYGQSISGSFSESSDFAKPLHVKMLKSEVLYSSDYIASSSANSGLPRASLTFCTVLTPFFFECPWDRSIWVYQRHLSMHTCKPTLVVHHPQSTTRSLSVLRTVYPDTCSQGAPLISTVLAVSSTSQPPFPLQSLPTCLPSVPRECGPHILHHPTPSLPTFQVGSGNRK